MPDLIRRVQGDLGKVQVITPESANWTYVGFDLYRLNQGEVVSEVTGSREHMLESLRGINDK